MALTTQDHDRRRSGRTYVYAVVSRRTGGVSVGIELNPNSQCNWRCVYCEVPGLTFGNAPPIDVEELECELEAELRNALDPGWLAQHAPGARLTDVAISGSGEPTSARELERVVDTIGAVLARVGLSGRVRVVLITNGSLVHQERVQRALAKLASLGGEVWFKLDSASAEGQSRINTNRAGVERTRKNLEIAAGLCPTWIQTCVFRWHAKDPSVEEQEAYLGFVRELAAARVPVKGVLLYGIARPSYQPEAPELSPLPREWLERFAERIRAAGLDVRVSV
jgi:wyosine [tRNA(Phe)-imidazoG37] synthetase (radical SAM superfamily)